MNSTVLSPFFLSRLSSYGCCFHLKSFGFIAFLMLAADEIEFEFVTDIHHGNVITIGETGKHTKFCRKRALISCSPVCFSQRKILKFLLSSLERYESVNISLYPCFSIPSILWHIFPVLFSIFPPSRIWEIARHSQERKREEKATNPSTLSTLLSSSVLWVHNLINRATLLCASREIWEILKYFCCHGESDLFLFSFTQSSSSLSLSCPSKSFSVTGMTWWWKQTFLFHFSAIFNTLIQEVIQIFNMFVSPLFVVRYRMEFHPTTSSTVVSQLEFASFMLIERPGSCWMSSKLNNVKWISSSICFSPSLKVSMEHWRFRQWWRWLLQHSNCLLVLGDVAFQFMFIIIILILIAAVIIHTCRLMILTWAWNV